MKTVNLIRHYNNMALNHFIVTGFAKYFGLKRDSWSIVCNSVDRACNNIHFGLELYIETDFLPAVGDKVELWVIELNDSGYKGWVLTKGHTEALSKEVREEMLKGFELH